MEQGRSGIETGISDVEAPKPDLVDISPDRPAPEPQTPSAERRGQDADLGLRFGEKIVNGVVKPRPKASGTQTW